MTVHIYGIRNCDTMKKAFAWLKAAGVAHEFHDYKRAGIDDEHLARWCAALGWEALINRRGTTWRKLDEAQRAAVSDCAAAIPLMQAQTSLIRRPLVEYPAADGSTAYLLGFDAEAFASALSPLAAQPEDTP